ncbi:MAG: ABC transporter permease [Oceanipulchritudo sp.]
MKMQLQDLLALSVRSLGTNKLRSGLTILGITIGVFSVVGVMTALSAVRQSIDTGLSVFAANVFEISRDPAVQFSGNRSRWRQRPNIKPREAIELAQRMGADGIPVTVYGVDSGERVRFEDRRTSPTNSIFGTNENFLLTNKYNIAHGRNLTTTDLEFNRPVIVLGADIAEELFPDMDPLGKSVVADDSRYTVIGVLERRGQLFGNSMDNIVLIPVSRFVANNWGHWRSMDISVMAPSATAMGATQDKAIGMFRQIRGLEPEEENDFEIYSNDSLQAAFAEIATIIGIGGLLISAIALLCAGVGIMNIMLVSVTERTREIGLRKSIGARRRDILRQFLLEAIALSLLGGVAGIILGWVVGNLVAAQMNVPMIVPWLWIGAAIGICTTIGVVFGFFPAYRAAGLKPVEALRYE